jgi:hypothetical protein
MLGQSLILLFPLALFSSISGVAKVVVKLILRSELPHVLTVRYKLWRFTLCDKSFPVFFFQVFELLKGVLLFSQTRHKSICVASLGMRDALHSCPLPLLFQLFWIYNISLNRVREELIFSHPRSGLQISPGLEAPFAGQWGHKPYSTSSACAGPKVAYLH